jgi:hyperosmotically inducible periplasmic protein
MYCKIVCMKARGFVIVGLWLLMGCSQPQKDMDIKSMIAVNAREDPAFAGVNYTVKGGVVTLSGSCPTQKEKDKVITRLNNTAGVKAVLDLIQIAPVSLTSDFPLKQAVDSVLMRYPSVQATVRDSTITLQGELKKEQRVDLMKALDELQAKGVIQQLDQK